MDFGFCLSPSSHVKMDSVDLTTFNRLKETNPDINTCIACGSCTATCTAGNFTEMSFRRIQDYLLQKQEPLLYTLKNGYFSIQNLLEFLDIFFHPYL